MSRHVERGPFAARIFRNRRYDVVGLRHDLFRDTYYLSRAKAERVEAELAAKLRERGFTVHGGH